MELGGYFSIKRNATSIDGDTWLDVEEVAPYCKAILEVFRSASTNSLAWPHSLVWSMLWLFELAAMQHLLAPL